MQCSPVHTLPKCYCDMLQACQLIICSADYGSLLST